MIDCKAKDPNTCRFHGAQTSIFTDTPKYDQITNLSERSKAKLASIKCPKCQNTSLLLYTKTETVIPPLGSYSIAGYQNKMVVKNKRSNIVKCELCDFETEAEVQ